MYTNRMKLEDTLLSHIPVQQDAMTNPDAYGIEVELEGQNITNAPISVMSWWNHHQDGSLRKLAPGDECIEYVSRKPYDMKQTEKSIAILFKFLSQPNVTVYESYRTSIHVHVNFAMEKFRTIYNFMTLCLIFDELLVSQNGEHRIGNNFCLRSKDAMGQTVALVQSIEKSGNFFNMMPQERYSSINFASLMKFGSVEFRSLECTTHEGRLLHWIGTLAEMKKRAKLFVNPTEIIQLFSQMGPREFSRSILGTFYLKYSSVPNMEDMLRNGMRIAQDLAYSSLWKESS